MTQSQFPNVLLHSKYDCSLLCFDWHPRCMLDHSDANPVQWFNTLYTQHTAVNINHFFLMLNLKIWFPLSLAEIPDGNPCSIDFFLIADSTFPHLMFQNFLLYHNFISSVIGFRSSWSTRQSPLWSRFPKSFILAHNLSKDCWKWEFLWIGNKTTNKQWMVLRKVSHFSEFARTPQKYTINFFLLPVKNFFRYL